MCGIFCSISRDKCTSGSCQSFEKVYELLKSRGPDHFGQAEISSDLGVSIHFCAAVLWTQGNSVCKQPAIDQSNNALLWNGDIFSGVDVGDKSDTEVLLELFNSKGLVEVLNIIEGPYSFIYYENNLNRLWFGRDPLGRVSLLWSVTSSSFILTSVSSPDLKVEELPPVGIYMLSLDSFEITVLPWFHQSNISYSLPSLIKYGQYITYNKLIDLVSTSKLDNVAEDGLIYLKEFKRHGDVPSLYNTLINDCDKFSSDVNSLNNYLSDAVRLRCTVRPPFCRYCKPVKTASCNHAKVGVLFSGGLDSTILALLADKYIPSVECIDLFNVAFEKPSPGGPYNAPDRLTGLSSLAELQKLAPNRTWNFVQIDVSRERLISMRDRHISKLIYPLNSILDESLGCALWFAASGEGTVNGLQYSSSATVVLLGMGADEIFGGYRKAKRAWLNGGWTNLSTELVSGLINLPMRNLGRDSRVVSDHSRVPRFPFIDESVVSFAYSLAPWQKCYLGRELPEGVGDKLLLRLLAWKLGLRSVATFSKRAIQFGSRIANSKEMGHNVSSNLRESWNNQINDS